MSSRGYRQQNDGDWTCPECNNLNFARRMQCNRCGAERKFEVKRVKKGGIEIGKQAAEKSKGLFSEDDWMCKTCGNVNWARRNECNMCNTPKVNVQEERTGYGGGFNEREGVEYKAKEDSDDEFDEFGRRKKKFRNKSSSTEQKTVPQHDISDEEESGDEEDASKYDLEAEDDDDDEEGDASKYDLAASDDDSRRSRSRSRNSSGRSSSRSSSRSRSRSRSSDRNSKERKRQRHYGRSRSKSRSRSRSPHHRDNRHSSSSKREKHH